MVNVTVPVWIFWSMLGAIPVLLGACVWIFIYFWNKDKTDKVLMFDKNMRWEIMPTNTKVFDFLERNKRSYFFKEDLGFLNKNGKSLYIFSENNSAPLKITNYKSEWLSPETLKGVINNKLVQMMIKPTDKMIDTMIILGAIGGLIAGISATVVLLIQLGVI